MFAFGAFSAARAEILSLWAERIRHRGILKIILVLLIGDAILIGLHVLRGLLKRMESPLLADFQIFELGLDGGPEELFGYAQTLACAILLMRSARIGREHAYLAWGLVFTLVLLDDSFNLHERMGAFLSATYALPVIPGLREQDSGELLAWSAMGLALVLPMAWAALRGPLRFVGVSMVMGIPFALLLLCAIGADMLHMAAGDHALLSAFLGIVEDGGELVAISLALMVAAFIHAAALHRAEAELWPETGVPAA